MNEEIYDDMALERICKTNFGFNVDVSKVIVRRVEVSPTCTATVFLTKKKQLLAFVTGQSKLTLGDVQKIITRMGLKAELFIPPKGQIDYFNVIGRDKFLNVFPGRSHVSDHDIAFYKTLAPYNPALVLISEVKDGHIRQFDSDSRGNWRVAAKFTYRRIQTS